MNDFTCLIYKDSRCSGARKEVLGLLRGREGGTTCCSEYGKEVLGLLRGREGGTTVAPSTRRRY